MTHRTAYMPKTDGLNTRLTEHKRATRNGDVNNHIAVHHQLTNHNIDWDSAQCLTYSINYFQRLTLESWYTNLAQTPLNRCQQLPAPYKRLFYDGNETDKRTSPGGTLGISGWGGAAVTLEPLTYTRVSSAEFC